MAFDDLNRLSEISIHRTSKKFNDPKDLMDRLELLGGSTSAGNDSVKQLAHTLSKIGAINKDQLNSLRIRYLLK